MRTLLVDNYDSFTYNLYQALAELNGQRPTVVRNDEPWDLAQLSAYDNVVISPGPGHPGTPRDFGLSATVIESARIPLLGVCLGHQGLALLAGATVAHAPEVRHGRLSDVHHDGTGLFADLPSPLRVVRYHSLAVTDLPASLAATAWTADGVLMGLRCRDRPAWGVQFHPESICTEHGTDLLANFAELTRRWHGSRPSPAPVLAPAPVEHPPADVLVRKLDLPITAEQVFDTLYAGSQHAFWLDSAASGGPRGRFSFLGDSSGPLARVATADVSTGEVTVTSGERVEVIRSGFFDWLERDLAARRTRRPDVPFGFTLGWVGYLGYELKAECGAAPAHHAGDPDAQLVFADRAVAIDHETGETYLLTLPGDGASAWLAEVTERLGAAAGSPVPAAPPPPPVDRVRLRHTRDEYLELIDRCLERIDQGETYEVCLTNQASAEVDLDPWQSYRWLRRASPAPFGAYLRLGELAVLSTSPERFLEIDAEGAVEARPIKGTRPRGRDEAQDALLRHDLATGEKDRAENLMIVDLLRNDLGVHAEIGSVRVPSIFEVETYATVHQLVSTVRARLAPGTSPVRCVRAAFPGGSMTGAPKLRTMELLDELEGGPRGVYSGALGYFALSGEVDLSIVIRTLVVRPGSVSFGVGGAVIALSDAHEEFEETAVKATALLRLLGVPFPGRLVPHGAAER